jgi:hypothetical protein
MNDTEKAFKEELDALLKKYKVELSLEETSFGYSGSTYRIDAFAYTTYDENGDIVSDTIDLDLGNYYTGE